MKFTWESLLTGTSLTVIVGFITHLLGIWRFKPKDKAEVAKLAAETANDYADVSVKKTEEDIKLSRTVMEFAGQLSAQLESANKTIERLNADVDRLRTGMITMRENFDKEMDELENMLAATKLECETEREKNRQLIAQLKFQINGPNK